MNFVSFIKDLPFLNCEPFHTSICHWLDLREKAVAIHGPDALPRRQDIDPLALRPVLSNIMLFEIHPDGRVYNKLAGVKITSRYEDGGAIDFINPGIFGRTEDFRTFPKAIATMFGGEGDGPTAMLQQYDQCYEFGENLVTTSFSLPLVNDGQKIIGAFCIIHFSGYKDLVTHGKLIMPFDKFRHLSNDDIGYGAPAPPADFPRCPDTIGDHLGPRLDLTGEI